MDQLFAMESKSSVLSTSSLPSTTLSLYCFFFICHQFIISLEVYVKLTYIVVSDTFLQHVTDLSGRETLVRITGKHRFDL